jgi:hypothetical protein
MPNTKVKSHNLTDTTVIAGSYGGGANAASITVDAQGRITAASNVAVSSGGSGGAESSIPTMLMLSGM